MDNIPRRCPPPLLLNTKTSAGEQTERREFVKTHLGRIENVQDLLENWWARRLILLLTPATDRKREHNLYPTCESLHLQNLNVAQFGIVKITFLLQAIQI